MNMQPMPFHSSQRGAVLVVSLLILLILTIVGVSGLHTTSMEEKMTSNKKLSIEALLAAETGIRDAITKMLAGTITDSSKTSASWNAGTSYAPSGLPSGVTVSYSVTHRLAGGGVAVNSEGDPFYLIQSTGTVGGVTRTVEAVLSLVYTGGGFPNALAGCDGVVFDSNGRTSSYSSSGQATSGNNGNVATLNMNGNVEFGSNADVNGSVNATGNITMDSNAKIRQNASANGDITLDSNAKISGNATAGGTVYENGGHNHNKGVQGTITNNAGTPVSSQDCDSLDVDQLVSDASALTFTSHPAYGGMNYQPGSNSTDTFTAGNYQFNSFKPDSNTQITISGDVVWYVNGNFQLDSNVQISFNPGATLKLYVTGRYLMDSNTCINVISGTGNCQNGTYGIPENFQLYSSAGASGSGDYKVTMQSNSTTYGVIYAPKAAVLFDSNAGNHGAIQGRWVKIQSNGTFVYDEDLASFGGGGAPSDYRLLYWRD